MPKRILALGHDAYRAGAQVEFLHVLRWLRANHDADISLVLRAGGDLLDDYASVVPVQVLETSSPPMRQRIARRLRGAQRTVDMRGIDLVYAGSAASAALGARLAADAGCPSICHVHELEMSMRRFVHRSRFRDASEHIDRFIAPCEAVERNLVVNHGIDVDRIDRIPEGIPLPQKTVPSDERARHRTELGIPLGAFVVGGCGTLDWRKGPEVYLFVAKALAASASPRPLHFLWVGGEGAALEMVQHDLERLGLEGTVSFVGIQPDHLPYFALFNAFLLSSRREDPFPLVALDAAALGLPIVCFADAGGMPEFVEDDAGYVVPYLDIAAAADRLLTLATSELTRAELGRRAAEKVAERCSIDVIGPQIASVLDRHLAPR